MKKVLRIIALLMCFALAITVFSGCGEKVVVSEKMVWVDDKGNKTEEGSSDLDDTDAASGDNTASSGNNTGTSPNNQNGTSGDKTGTSNDKNASSGNGSGASSGNNSQGGSGNGGSSSKGKINPEDYRGTTVTYATWSDPFQNESASVVKGFIKKYGINVKIDIVPEANYVQELTANVLAGKAPDVIDANSTYLTIIKNLRPIDDMKIDLTDEVWDTDFINTFRVNGKSYLVNTMGNHHRMSAITYYNKKIFKNAGIKTPEQYYKEGNWTLDTMKTCLEELAEIGGDIIPGMLYFSQVRASFDANIYTIKNGKIATNYDNPKKLEDFKYMMRYYLQLEKDGLVSTQSNDFKNGKAGIAIAETWGLQTNGRFSTMPAEDMGFTYLPSYNGTQPKAVTTIRGWGSPKGSKNPVGAGLFLRHYLDGSNYPSSTFKSAEAEKFFYEVTNYNADEVYYEIDAMVAFANDKTLDDIWPTGDPSTVTTQVDSKKNAVKKYADTVNKMLDAVK